jgi:hypothetical protein
MPHASYINHFPCHMNLHSSHQQSYRITTHGETLLCRTSQTVLDCNKLVFLYQTITGMKEYEGNTPK